MEWKTGELCGQHDYRRFLEDRAGSLPESEALKMQWKKGMPNQPHIFWESDVTKWIEGAAYFLKKERDPELEAKIDELVGRMERTQDTNGYLNAYFTVVEPKARFTRRTDHELYCAGHLIEGAIAYKEATKYGDIHVAASSEDQDFTYIPTQDQLQLTPDASYFYYCANNTIYGTEWQYVPETGDVPLVCDMSSDILSRQVDVSKYGIIFAGAQKNMAPAGLTVAIVKEELAGHALP